MLQAVGKAPPRNHWRVSVASASRGPIADVASVLFEPPPGVDGPPQTLVDANPFELVCHGRIPGGDIVITLFFRTTDDDEYPPYPPVSFIHPLPTAGSVAASRYLLEYDPNITRKWDCFHVGSGGALHTPLSIFASP